MMVQIINNNSVEKYTYFKVVFENNIKGYLNKHSFTSKGNKVNCPQSFSVLGADKIIYREAKIVLNNSEDPLYIHYFERTSQSTYLREPKKYQLYLHRIYPKNLTSAIEGKANQIIEEEGRQPIEELQRACLNRLACKIEKIKVVR